MPAANYTIKLPAGGYSVSVDPPAGSELQLVLLPAHLSVSAGDTFAANHQLQAA